MAKQEREREMKGFSDRTSRGELRLEAFKGQESRANAIETRAFNSDGGIEMRGMGGGRDEGGELEKSKTGVLRKIGATLILPATLPIAIVGGGLYVFGRTVVGIAKYFGFDEVPTNQFVDFVGEIFGRIVGTIGAYFVDVLLESYGVEARKLGRTLDDDELFD